MSRYCAECFSHTPMWCILFILTILLYTCCQKCSNLFKKFGVNSSSTLCSRYQIDIHNCFSMIVAHRSPRGPSEAVPREQHSDSVTHVEATHVPGLNLGTARADVPNTSLAPPAPYTENRLLTPSQYRYNILTWIQMYYKTCLISIFLLYCNSHETVNNTSYRAISQFMLNWHSFTGIIYRIGS